MPTIVGQKLGQEFMLESDGNSIVFERDLEYIISDPTRSGDAMSIYSTPGLPKVNEQIQIPGVPYKLYCTGKRAKQWEKKESFWDVTCSLSSKPPTTSSKAGGGENSPLNPTSWYSLIKGDFEEMEEVVISDINGFAIVNTALRRYDSPFTKTRKIPAIRWTQYELATRPIDQILQWNDTLNQSTFLNKERGTWRLNVDNWALVVVNGFFVWELDLKLRYIYREIESSGKLVKPIAAAPGFQDTGTKKHHWQEAILQRDWIQKNNKPCIDGNGNQIEDNIGIDGLQLAKTDPRVYVLHEVFHYANFGNLRIRQTR